MTPFQDFFLHFHYTKRGKIKGRKESKPWLLTSENSKQSKLCNNSMKVEDVIRWSESEKVLEELHRASDPVPWLKPRTVLRRESL